MTGSNPDRSELLAALRMMPLDQHLTVDYPRRTGRQEFREWLEEFGYLAPNLSGVRQVAAKHLPEPTRRHVSNAEGT